MSVVRFLCFNRILLNNFNYAYNTGICIMFSHFYVCNSAAHSAILAVDRHCQQFPELSPAPTTRISSPLLPSCWCPPSGSLSLRICPKHFRCSLGVLVSV